MKQKRRVWAVVLAGGEGSRLAPLTRALYGKPLPKQFAVLRGQRSLLQHTMERLSSLCDASHTVVVVPAEYEDLARIQLEDWKGAHVVAQPRNRGTGPGVMLPLARVLAHDPDADVVLSPSDHHASDARPLLSAVRAATRALDDVPVSLVAVRATRPETEYGWIRPGARRHGRVRHLSRFVEKPTSEHAEELLAQGALWNTFLIVARGAALWARAASLLPDHADRIVRQQHCPSALADAYEGMSDANFSTRVLERCTDLGVVSAGRSGWTDLGSPARVLSSMDHGPERDRLIEQMARAS
jgi:mannose-1-phosphate guanylyltransferase